VEKHKQEIHAWIRKESETNPGTFYYWNTLTHESRSNPPDEGPRVVSSRLTSNGLRGVKKHVSHQIARAGRESAKRKKRRTQQEQPNGGRHGAYDHWGERKNEEIIGDVEVVMSDIQGHHQKHKDTRHSDSDSDSVVDLDDNNDYFDDIDSMLEHHDSLKTTEEEGHFHHSNPMLRQKKTKIPTTERNATSIDSELPVGWNRIFHQESGKHYYHNEVTDETCWVHPGKHTEPQSHFVNPQTGARFDVDHL
jgi:hypothetical protein